MAVYENNNEYASKGVAGAGLGLGIAGTAIGLLASHTGLNGLFGGSTGSVYETKGEAELQRQLALANSTIALKDAEINTDRKSIELYKYVEGRFHDIDSRFAQQAVVNAQITGNIAVAQNNIASLQAELAGLTRTIIPIGNVCPEPMPAKNAWVSPSSSSNSTGG